MSYAVLLYFALVVSQDSGKAGANVTGSGIGGIIMFVAPFILVATILNEVLVDRAWRRVIHATLGYNAGAYQNEKLSRNLRAANFEWLNIMKRLYTHELSLQDFRSMAIYVLLR